MTKLEEILGTTLPTSINKNNTKVGKDVFEIGKIEKPEFLKAWVYGDRFMLFDYPEISDELEGCGIDVYCLSKPSGEPTSLISEAYQETKKLGIPYIELHTFSSGGCKVIRYLVVDKLERFSIYNKFEIYTPVKGNTIRNYGWAINDKGVFDFDWRDKKVLEESDLLYIVKDIRRDALCKYSIEEIYNAFQEYKDGGVESIIIPDRELCLDEFENMLYIRP